MGAVRFFERMVPMLTPVMFFFRFFFEKEAPMAGCNVPPRFHEKAVKGHLGGRQAQSADGRVNDKHLHSFLMDYQKSSR